MRIDILTLFPEMFDGPFEASILKRAQAKQIIDINIYNLRDWGQGERKTVDGRPYGGGVGMILMIEPIYKALKELRTADSTVVLLCPQGKQFNQSYAYELSEKKHLILICGRYEGVDERVRKHLVDLEISIGDYVLTGGEIPAMVVVDCISRLIPNVIVKPEALKRESFSEVDVNDKKIKLLEHEQYTRPEEFEGWSVPKILLSGDHKKIEEWQTKESLEKTKKKRPDIL